MWAEFQFPDSRFASNRQQLPAVDRVRGPRRHVGHQLRGLRLAHPFEDVVDRLLKLGRTQVRGDSFEDRQHRALVNSPGQAKVLAQGVDGQVGRADRDERLVAIDREIRRQRDVAISPGDLQVTQVAVQRAIEKLGQVITLAIVERQAECFEVPAVLSVPARGQLPQGVADLVGGKVAQGQDHLPADARIGVVDQSQEDIEMLQGGRRLLGLGILVFDVAVLAAVAAEDAHGLLADASVPSVHHLGQRGHRDRIPLDRVPDPKRPGPIDRIGVMDRQVTHLAPVTFSSLPRAISPRRAASCVAILGDLSAAINPGTVPKSTLTFSRLMPLGHDAIDPPGRLVAEGMAADPRVVPVGHEHRAIRGGAGVDRTEPRVVAGEKDLGLGPERGPFAGQGKEIDLASAGVDLEDAAPVLGR